MTRLTDIRGATTPTVSAEGHRLGTCVICKLGIFAGQPEQRTRGMWLGRSHTECADRVGVGS